MRRVSFMCRCKGGPFGWSVVRNVMPSRFLLGRRGPDAFFDAAGVAGSEIIGTGLADADNVTALGSAGGACCGHWGVAGAVGAFPVVAVLSGVGGEVCAPT